MPRQARARELVSGRGARRAQVLVQQRPLVRGHAGSGANGAVRPVPSQVDDPFRWPLGKRKIAAQKSFVITRVELYLQDLKIAEYLDLTIQYVPVTIHSLPFSIVFHLASMTHSHTYMQTGWPSHELDCAERNL